MNIAFVFGTRPEVIKMAPVILEARKRNIKTKVIHTGQHRDLASPLFKFFGIEPDLNLDAMADQQSLAQLSFKILSHLERDLSEESFDWVFVQGDTTSAFVGAYWAFCRRARIAHVEAGLRTYDLSSPFPEEANRQLVGRIADLHFAPTEAAKNSLLSEGTSPEKIVVTGNTSIDSLLYTLNQTSLLAETGKSYLAKEISSFIEGGKVITLTVHRRENHGLPLNSICRAVKTIAHSGENVRVVVSVHPNPNVRNKIRSELASIPNVYLTEPLDYISFVELMKKSDLLLTDSGGVQEEAPSLRKPVLVMRNTTERPEGIEAGYSELVGTEENYIVRRTLDLLKVGCLGKGENPYGSGQASIKIMDKVVNQ